MAKADIERVLGVKVSPPSKKKGVLVMFGKMGTLSRPEDPSQVASQRSVRGRVVPALACAGDAQRAPEGHQRHA